MTYSPKEVDDALQDYKIVIEKERKLNKKIIDVRIETEALHHEKRLVFARLREVTGNQNI